MSTDQTYARLYNKKILPLDQFKDKFLDYMIGSHRAVHKDAFFTDGVFTSAAVITASGNNAVSAAGTFRGVTGSGKTIDVAAHPSLQDVKIPPDAGVAYHVGLEQNDVDSEVEIEPRTGQVEYRLFKEIIGRLGTPDSVTDNGNGTITFNVNGVTQSGKDHSGRQVRVWLKSRADGGIGPLSASESVAFETRTIAFSNPNNTITTVAKFGQGAVSTTASNYRVLLVGPTVRQASVEDLSAAVGVLFLASVTSVAAGFPITVIDNSGQAVITSSISEMGANITELRQGFDEVMRAGVISNMVVSNGGGLNASVAGGVYWKDGDRRTFTAATIAVTNAATNYVYIDINNNLATTTVAANAVQLGRMVLAQVVAAGGVITTITDLRKFWARVNSNGKITVGPVNCHFIDLRSAILWLKLHRTDGEGPNDWAIEIIGNVTLTAQVTFDIPLKLRGSTRGIATITGPAGVYQLRPTANALHGTSIEGITWNVSTAAGGGWLDLTAGGGDNWIIRDNIVIGGRDTAVIKGSAGITSDANWTVENNWFKDNANSVANPVIDLNANQNGWNIRANRFDGGTANLFSQGINTQSTSSDHLIDGNFFTMGGVHITLGGTSGSVENRIARNKFSSSRGQAFVHNGAGTCHVIDNTFTGCATNGVDGNGVLEFTGTGSRVSCARNKVVDWATGGAIKASSQDGATFQDNYCTTTAAAVIQGLNLDCTTSLIEGNYVDLDRGATSGNGKGGTGAYGLSMPATAEFNTVTGNVIRNIGDGTTATNGAMRILGNDNIVHGNHLRNIRGTIIDADNDNNHVVDNVATDSGDGAAVLSVTGRLTPTEPAADQNNYNPTGLGAARFLRIGVNNAGNPISITGIVGGVDGRILVIQNIDANTGEYINLVHESASSTAGNRFALPDNLDYVIRGAGGAVALIYDGVSLRWRLLSADPQYMYGQLGVQSTISPAQINGDQNNYAPTGLAGASVIFQDVVGAGGGLTGLTGGVHGRLMFLFNRTTAGGNFFIRHENAGSTASNRFVCPAAADLTIRPQGGVLVRYDGVALRWGVVAP